MECSTIKCVVVGDEAVGKTCMLITYSCDAFPHDYVPRIFDNYGGTSMFLDGHCLSLELCDTAGQEDYDRLRPYAYNDADVFLLCYSSTSDASLRNAKIKWYPEVRHHSPNAPIVLVATQTDLRDHLQPDEVRQQRTIRGVKVACVSTEEGKRAANEIAAGSFVECSALTKDNLALVFSEAVRLVIDGPPTKRSRRNSKCSLF